MRISVVLKGLVLALGCLSVAQALGAAHDGDLNIDGDVAPLVSGIPQPNGDLRRKTGRAVNQGADDHG